MKKILPLSLLLLLFVYACNKKDEDNNLIIITETGDLNVSVSVNGYYPADQAMVYTNPASQQGFTDAFGSVLLKGIEPGSYEVFSSLSNVGSGKSVINIKANELNEVHVNIIEGVNVGIAPIINLILPQTPAEFSENDTITFSADISDDETLPQNILVTWESSLDGVFNTTPPDANFHVQFSTTSLSRGVHEITLTAEDEEGYKNQKTFEVSTLSPKSVELYEPIKTNGKVVLNWSKFQGSAFLKYEVFRSDENCSAFSNEIIGTIDDVNTTTFTDEQPPMEYQVCYHIRVSNTEYFAKNSNSQTVEQPSGYIFNFVPNDMLKHPTENFVYLIDKSGNKLIKFDYVNMELVQETLLQGTIGYIDIADNGFGVEVYVPSSDGWVYVYSADDLSQTFSINTGLPTASVVTNGAGYIVASLQPSPWWEDPVRTYSRSNGMLIDGNGDFDRDRLRMIPGSHEIISISTGISPTDMEYFLLNENGFIEEHHDDDYHGDYPLDATKFRISEDGSYAITSWQGAVYAANSGMEYKGQLQHGSLHFSDFAFSSDGADIYAATSDRKSIQIGHYPSLIRDNEILTRGFPIFIIRDGNQIIAISKADENSYNTGIEILDIP